MNIHIFESSRPQSLKTYGRNRSKTATTTAGTDMTNVVNSAVMNDPPASRKRERKIAHDDEHGGIENTQLELDSSINRMDRSRSLSSITSVPKPVRDCAPIQRHSKSKRPICLEDLVVTAHPDDIIKLVQLVKAADKGGLNLSPSGKSRIYDDGTEKCTRFLSWLNSLGFSEAYWGEAVVYDIAEDSMKALVIALARTTYWQSVEAPRARNRTAFSALKKKAIPSILIPDPAKCTADAQSSRAPTPSRMLTDAFSNLTFRGETPQQASRDMPTGTFTFAGPTEQEQDDHDAEVRSIILSSVSSGGSVHDHGHDACSSRGSQCLSYMSENVRAEAASRLEAPSPLSEGEGRSSVGLAHAVAMDTDGDDVLGRRQPVGDYVSRSFSRSRRSVSAPMAPNHQHPSSPVHFSKTFSAAYDTPVKFEYISSRGALTHLLAKCKNAMLKKVTGQVTTEPTAASTKDCSGSGGEIPVMNRSLFSTYPCLIQSTTSHHGDSEDLSASGLSDSFLAASRLVLEARRNSLNRARGSGMESSPIVSCAEKMFVIPESGEDEADIDAVMLSMAYRDNRLSTLKKKRMSNSKRFRMSSHGKPSKAKQGRRSSIFSLKNSSRPQPQVPSSPVEVVASLPTYLTEENFYPVVVGGIYQQAFEFNRPVVYESISSFPRVQSLDMPLAASSAERLTSSITRLRAWYMSTVRSLSYQVYNSQGEHLDISVLPPGLAAASTTFELGENWAVVPASPGGLLVVSTKHSFHNDKRRMCFFVSDSFLRKELLCDVELSEFGGEYKQNNDDHIAMADDVNNSQCTESTEPDDMDCMGMHFAGLDTSNVSDTSKGSDYLCSSHHHLAMHFDTDHGGHGISPTASGLGGGLFFPSPMHPADRNHTPLKSCTSGGSITAGMTVEGDAYIRSIMNKDGAFSVQNMHDLVNSGDIMELVLPFLDDSSNKPKSTARKLQRLRSTRGSIIEPTGFQAVKLVNKRWAVNWMRYKSTLWAPKEWDLKTSDEFDKWVAFLRRFGTGIAVGCGGAKTVFRMQRVDSSGLIQRTSTVADAVAVMDVECVLDHAVRQELVVSAACSALVKCNICPNIVQIYGAFQSPYPAPPMWESLSNSFVIPTRESMPAGHYQYINMEFCTGGDIEDYIRKQRKNTLSCVDIRNMFFQMCMSLYSCREQLSLRHFDIKLLNFLLADGSALISDQASASTRYEKVVYRVGFGEHVYALNLCLSTTTPGLVKLADFGTSLIGNDSAHCAISAQQFTTLENTAPEFLFLGSGVSSSAFASDTFGLGLSFLHLVTGIAPYEELMEQVRCPEALQLELQKIWTTSDEDSPYTVLGEVLSSLDVSMDMDDSDAADSSVMSVLYDTLYRYVVLVGLPEANLFSTVTSTSPSSPKIVSRNPVVDALLRTLDQAMNGNASTGVAAATMQYLDDCAVWNIFEGSGSVMKSARKKMKELSLDAGKWLRRMLCFDPLHRCVIMELITSAIFEPLIEKSSSENSSQRSALTRNQMPSAVTFTSSFMYYWRPGDGGDRQLPML